MVSILGSKEVSGLVMAYHSKQMKLMLDENAQFVQISDVECVFCRIPV